MAHVDHNVSVLSVLRNGYYNVTGAVGPVDTAPNHRDDVLLVQYLLKAVANGTYRPAAGDWTPPSPAKSFRVDGQMGSFTAAWIKSYQKACNEKGTLLRVDNRIDRARGDIGSISRTLYTILALNADFAQVQPAKYQALEDAADAPFELRAIIRTTRAQNIISIFPTINTMNP